ncbi:MAG: transporter [Panacagrimonas sp.]|jgi:FHS family L-fucose permease-like MFS transporter|nr:sugar MFS transporter [Panacagrimonas sp.]MCC2656112.1 transporter [Panacagrimonas sp.]
MQVATGSNPSDGVDVGPRPGVTAMIVGLFFAWGFCTVLVDSLVPKLKGLFSLSYAEAMLSQFAFFLAYLVVSIPAGLLLARIGYLHSIVAGLAVTAAGCLLFTPAASMGLYPVFLLALFVLASGITLLQVAANPLIANLGDKRRSHVRLNLAQAFNSLGTTIGPWLGAAFILAGGVELPGDPSSLSPEALAALRVQEADVVRAPFLGIATVLGLFAMAFWLLRRQRGMPPVPQQVSGRAVFAPLRHPRLALATLSIFLYVGAEVAIGSVLVNYLMLPGTLGETAERAGRLVSLYWGGAMVGRFVGSMLMRRVQASSLLAMCALVAATLATASSFSVGHFAAATIIAIGLFNSIMFPTIFSLGIEKLGDETPQGSALLCLAIVGGAVIPVVTGAAADRFGLSSSLLVPAICYLGIAAFAVLTRRGVLDRGHTAAS